MMRKPYIKHYKNIQGFKVYIVDGAYIRKHLDTQFTDFGQHYRFPNMIPLKEFWLDKQYSSPKEYDVFIIHLLKEWESMRSGKSYGVALEEANIDEKNQRELMDADGCRITQIGTLEDDTDVWLVSGKKIRDDGYIDFTEGGHDLIYNWIPNNEIWLDDAVPPKERPYILLHESYERNRMMCGDKYKTAHNKASIEERKARHEQPRLTFIKHEGILYIGNKSRRAMFIDGIKTKIRHKLPYINKQKRIHEAIVVTKC